MSVKTLTLTIPTALASELESVNQDFLVDLLKRGIQTVKIERALAQYSQGDISFGAAAHRAGISQSDLARHAYARGMEPPFSLETLNEELN